MSHSVYWHNLCRKTERNTRKETEGFPVASETNRPVQPWSQWWLELLVEDWLHTGHFPSHWNYSASDNQIEISIFRFSPGHRPPPSISVCNETKSDVTCYVSAVWWYKLTLQWETVQSAGCRERDNRDNEDIGQDDKVQWDEHHSIVMISCKLSDRIIKLHTQHQPRPVRVLQ